MSEAAFSFGPLGAMTDLVVAPEVGVENGRELKSTVTSRGVRWVQRARRNPRTWTVSRPWRDPAWARMLTLAAHGVGGDMWLYDRATARQNMLPAHEAVGDGNPVKVDGLPMGAVSWVTTSVGVIAGRTYTLSAWGSGTPTSASITGTWKTASGATVGPPIQIVGDLGIGAIREITGVAPAGAVTLELARSSGPWAGVRVHEGESDGAFCLTEGTPCRVAVPDPQRTYQMVTDTATAIDYEITLMEVG